MSAHVQVKAGEAAELSCEVTRGSPTPEIVWSRQVREDTLYHKTKQDQRNLTKSVMAPLYPPPVTG